MGRGREGERQSERDRVSDRDRKRGRETKRDRQTETKREGESSLQDMGTELLGAELALPAVRYAVKTQHNSFFQGLTTSRGVCV